MHILKREIYRGNYDGDIIKTCKDSDVGDILIKCDSGVVRGFQDAYTYNVRNGVFSNAQTGNVVLMSQHLMEGNWMRALHYLFPVLAFAFGVLVAERIGHTYKNARKIHWRQIVVLIEILILLAVGFMPQKFNMAATMLVSFACAMQVQTFRKVNGYGYASTMCIGNLRSGTESLSVYIREHQKGHFARHCITTESY